ncbi:MAG: 3-dehydroquinate synthase [Armatimonadetes bacterium]|nr:3-dehydroquinate synthase [Armatimonadota bacterium]
MSSRARTVTIDLGERSYPVHIGAGQLSALGRHLREQGLGQRALIGTNAVVWRHYGALVQQALDEAQISSSVYLVPSGERAKKLATLEQLCDTAIEAGLDRRSVVIALGGGVVGDLVGFAAACLYRGVNFVQIPTTLVAMVDSSVGGKTGVNSRLGKNLIGAFWQPRLVTADLDTLRSLPARELRCGLAEVIKHGCILDRDLLATLEEHLVERPGRGDLPLTGRVGLSLELAGFCVERSCELKGAVVAADERESGQRAWLNYGHTFGHALEAVCGYGKLHHGEAVAIGMVLAARLGVRRGDLPAADAARIERLLVAAGLPTKVPAGTSMNDVFAAMHRDKKAQGGALRLTLLRGLGEAMVSADTPPEMVEELLQEAGREAEHEDG